MIIVCAAILLISVSLVLFGLQNSYTLNNLTLSFETSNYFVYSFNGSPLSFQHNDKFMLINTSSTPISVVMSDNLLTPSGNLSNLASSTFKGALTQTLIFTVKPVFGSNGLENEPSLLLYSGNAVGDVNQLRIYVRDSPWTTHTDGRHYIVTNGTYTEYLFMYASSNSLSSILSNSSGASSMLPENSTLFPAQFVSYLSNITENTSVPFFGGGSWWYYGYANGSFISPSSVPNGYRRWSAP